MVVFSAAMHRSRKQETHFEKLLLQYELRHVIYMVFISRSELFYCSMAIEKCRCSYLCVRCRFGGYNTIK